MTINTAEILCVGTEILIGDIVNTNAAFLSQRLTEMGIAQYHQSVVGDNPERMEEAIRQALSRCDLLILTGGLGPTYDDLTKQIAARAVGLSCEIDEECLRDVKAFYDRRGTAMRGCDLQQAMMPRGAHAFRNRYGSAPGVGIAVPGQDKFIVLMPGPPREMRPMFDEEVRPYLEQFTNGVIVSRNLNIIGMGEPEVEQYLAELMRTAVNPSVAPYVSEGEVRLRISAKAQTKEEGYALCDQTAQIIRRSPVGACIYGTDTSLHQAVVQALKEKKRHIASAESCTGGLFAAKITEVPGASDVIEGSVVTYANRIKEQLTSVSHDTLERYGAVSEQTAREMCRGVRKLFCADIGVSITGLAGPGGGTEALPVGTVFVGVSDDRGEEVQRLRLDGTREYIRTVAVKRALAMVLRRLREH